MDDNEKAVLLLGAVTEIATDFGLPLEAFLEAIKRLGEIVEKQKAEK